jgi:hypothetical protein
MGLTRQAVQRLANDMESDGSYASKTTQVTGVRSMS